ncbi:PREDICTED: uncharacterized protein LOC104596285 [Nelumbo nucifera]|uniref:Uncharacterized protein LOC104596285 n=1 Tax=Nelumbo nucifera TaxID=4432 RepID=A0A1U8A384_NELNU|nr:PREDICTED: uncharacterized protein LOC104596285 [Nelumbo nucifera]
MSYIDGTITQPMKVITKNGQSINNPDFMLWEHLDQFLLSWILSSLTKGVLAQVIGYTTSKSVWDALARLFASRSQACIMQLRFELIHLKKTNLSMVDYLQKARLIYDNLAAVGELVSNFELIQFVLGGLGPDYESLVTPLLLRVGEYTFDSIQALLTNHELWLEYTRTLFESFQPQTNMAVQKSYQSVRTDDYRNKQKTSNGKGKKLNPFQGAKCQICHNLNHTAYKCRARFDNDFRPEKSSPATYTASIGPVIDNSWYPDSGASHHMIADLANLHLQSEYSEP